MFAVAVSQNPIGTVLVVPIQAGRLAVSHGAASLSIHVRLSIAPPPPAVSSEGRRVILEWASGTQSRAARKIVIRYLM